MDFFRFTSYIIGMIRTSGVILMRIVHRGNERFVSFWYEINRQTKLIILLANLSAHRFFSAPKRVYSTKRQSKWGMSVCIRRNENVICMIFSRNIFSMKLASTWLYPPTSKSANTEHKSFSDNWLAVINNSLIKVMNEWIREEAPACFPFSSASNKHYWCITLDMDMRVHVEWNMYAEWI